MAVGKRINVFISSAMTELEYDREIVQQALANMNVNPVLFEVFPAMSQSPSDRYLDEVRECDIFVMLLWKTLRPAILAEYYQAIKSNKPILIFVKTLIENETRDAELTDFILKLSSGSSQPLIRRATYRYYRRVRELRDAVCESTSLEIAKLYREPIHTLSREEMYELGTSIIQSAQRRLYLFQRTPSIIVGARDYLAGGNTKYAYEKEFSDVLGTWIAENHQSEDKEFLYVFSAQATREEIMKHNLGDVPEFRARMERDIAELKRYEEASAFRFRFGIVDPISGPLIVGDSRFAFWLLGVDDAVSISQKNEKVCDILVRMLKAHCQTAMDTGEILAQLGIS